MEERLPEGRWSGFVPGELFDSGYVVEVTGQDEEVVGEAVDVADG